MADTEMRSKTIRLSEKASNKFDSLAQGYENFGSALEAMMASYELSYGAQANPGYKANIEAVLTHTTRIQELYAEAVKAIGDATERERLAGSKRAEALQSAIEAAISERDEARASLEAAKSLQSETQALLDGAKAEIESLKSQMQDLGERQSLAEVAKMLKEALEMAESKAQDSDKPDGPES